MARLMGTYNWLITVWQILDPDLSSFKTQTQTLTTDVDENLLILNSVCRVFGLRGGNSLRGRQIF